MPSKTKSRPAATDTVDADLPEPPEFVEIHYKDETFTVPKSRDLWSMRSELALYEARATNLSFYWTQFVELGLGPEQWIKVQQLCTTRGEFVDFTKQFIDTVFSECIG